MQDIEVLIVDDSAVVRKVLSRVLDAADGVHVMGVAQHPLIAMERMKRQQPDVIVLDIEMPHMDGLTFLRRIMAEDPIPVVICSVQTSAGSEAAMQALRAGAVEVVAKPTRGIQDFLANSAPELVAAVRAAAQARLRGHQHIVAPAPAEMPVHTPVPRRDRGAPRWSPSDRRPAAPRPSNTYCGNSTAMVRASSSCSICRNSLPGRSLSAWIR